MKCVVCKHGEIKAGETTMTIDRGNMIVVIRNIPALVCETCGEEYVSNEVMKELEIAVERAQGAGVDVAVRHFKAA